MKATSITYARLFNKGNYEHERIEIQVALEDGDTPEQALNRAKAFVAAQNPEDHGGVTHQEYDNAKALLADAELVDAHTREFVDRCKELVSRYDSARAEARLKAAAL